MDQGKMFPLVMQPGIQRDGTSFASRRWTDGEWCRFQRGLPRKIGGYKQITENINSVPRGTFVIPRASVSEQFYVYVGTGAQLQYQLIDSTGSPIGPLVNRTPIGFPPSDNNDWMFDLMYSTIDNTSTLIAHAGQNLASIDSRTETPVYFGAAQTNTPIVSTGFRASGGIVVLHPFLFIYGNDGDVRWTEANNPTNELDSARVTGQKIVFGLPTRGGNSSPAGLLWSLDSVIRVTMTGINDIEFTFDTVTSQSSILSNSSVVQYDNLYFWLGTDRAFYYNGTVNTLKNDQNLNYFYDNLNFDAREKVWATKIPHFNEVWWFYPRGEATECTHAIIYNLQDNCWYDTPIERSSGYYDQTFRFPIWTSSTTEGAFYPLWLHEAVDDNGDLSYDQNVDNVVTAIESYIKSGSIAWCAVGPDGQFMGTDRWVYLYRFEPDIIQSGNLTFTVGGRPYARGTEENSVFTITAATTHLDIFEQRREMTLKFESNVIGGNYEFGQNLMVMRLGDARQ